MISYRFPTQFKFSILGFICTLLILSSVQVHAVIETYEFDDVTLNERYNKFTAELRCPQCQNQNLSGSNSLVAKDLRREVHRLLQEGKSDQEIIDYMVARYGNFILYRPQFNAETALLWLAPAIFLVLGIVALVFAFLRQRGKASVSSENENLTLDMSEQEQLHGLLDVESNDSNHTKNQNSTGVNKT